MTPCIHQFKTDIPVQCAKNYLQQAFVEIDANLSYAFLSSTALKKQKN